MAAGTVIKPKSQLVNAYLGEVKFSYSRIRRAMDALIAAKNSGGGNNWTKVAEVLGEADAIDGQAVFENLDAVMAYMTSANDAASPMDGGAV